MSDEKNMPELDELSRYNPPSAFAGQKLFIRGEDWQHNARLGWSEFPDDLYASGYKEAADALLHSIMEKRVPLDSVIFPLIFLHRHSLELQLKIALPLARRAVGENANKDHEHGLMPMWVELRRLMEKIDPRTDAELSAIGSFIEQLDEVDGGSFAFRYSTSRSGKSSLPDLKDINVRHLSEILDSVYWSLYGIYTMLLDAETPQTT